MMGDSGAAFSIALPSPVRQVLDALAEAGYPAYVVGGCVRDALRGLTPSDWDVCTAARPEDCKRALSRFHMIDTGIQHGTVTAVVDSMPIEITTYRVESGYSDGRHPDQVIFVDRLEEDLARRDFTINAMAWRPDNGICDPFGGQKDLRTGVLRCVGDPDKRFTEDALRIARGLRFMAATGFPIEPETAAAMRRQQERLDDIARERLCAELSRLLTGRYVGRVLRAFPDVLVQILPELASMVHCPQHNPHHAYGVWEHSVRATEAVPDELPLRLAMLLHDSGKPLCRTTDDKGIDHFYGHSDASRAIAEHLLHRLKFDNETTKLVTLLVDQHDRPLGETPKQVRRRLRQYGEGVFRALLRVKKADSIGQNTHPEAMGELLQTEKLLNQTLAEDACFSLKQLAVDGNDMLALGLQGPQIGQTLQHLLTAVIDEQMPNEREALLALATEERETT